MYIDYYILNPKRLNKIKKLDWYNLWIKKSDYIINCYENIKGKNSIIDESINYYMVMLDMGICYLKEYSNYYDYVYIQHGIILDNNKYIKEDIKERDFAEYLKYLFYNNYDIEKVYNLIKNGNDFNYNLVVARLLYPSYYLFYLEEFVINNNDYDKLLYIINRTNEYEVYVKSVVSEMNNFLSKKIVLPF